MTHIDRPPGKRFVEGADWKPRWKRPKLPDWAGDVPKADGSKVGGGQRVAPIVEVSHDERRECVGRTEEHVPEYPGHLTMPLSLGEPQMRVHQMHHALGRVNQ